MIYNMPIIRSELLEYVDLWNHHKIKTQNDRPYLVSGLPYLLYH